MTRLAMVLSFDGRGFAGWQAQQGLGERTVQATVEEALGKILGLETRVVVEGAGRTDAGAHAEGMVAAADVPRVPERPRRRLNGVLPDDVRVRGVALVPDGFQPRRAARGKRYAYRFWLDAVSSPLRRHAWFHRAESLDLDAMREAAGLFVGERDFAALQATGSSVETTVRRIDRCEIAGEPPDVRLVVEGSGFLRHMVRAMAGSLLLVGRGRHEPAWIRCMLDSKSRAAAGPNLPAHALVLEHVFYDEPIAGLLARAVAGEDPASPGDDA